MNLTILNCALLDAARRLENSNARAHLTEALENQQVVSQIAGKLALSLTDSQVHSAEFGTVHRFIAFATFAVGLETALRQRK
jgi:hypothetical protein